MNGHENIVFTNEQENHMNIFEDFLKYNFRVVKHENQQQPCYDFYGIKSGELLAVMDSRTDTVTDVFKELVTLSEVITLEELLIQNN
ncbi:hypothetical protein ACQKND_16405 [Viridibacillus arvi]|uniref:hypothetical protein n=1 Tax=Viridibacillus arvi TaxID=263475 RepID=UPI003D06F37F